MASEEGNALAFEESGDDGLGRIAEGRLDANFLSAGEAFHRVQAAAADDADGGLRFFARTLLVCFQGSCSLSR